MTAEALLANFLAAGVAHCHVVAVEHGNLIVMLFMAGLLGGLGHCAGMCGPFVLSQTLARLQTIPAGQMRELHRLTGAALLPYHLGRATTYVALGVAVAAVAGGVIDLTGLRSLSAALLALAALFFAGYALQRLRVPIPWLARGGEGWWSRRIGRRLRPWFAEPLGWRGYGLGLALGFLPCGLLYGSLAAAGASGHAVAGGLGMAAFALGTVPALMAIGFAGHTAGDRWRQAAARVMPVIMLFNAGALSWFAWRLMA